jgi:hypothetical protein
MLLFVNNLDFVCNFEVSMKTAELTETEQRNNPRINVLGLTGTIRPQEFLQFSKPVPCNIVDINRGGVGIVSARLNMTEGQKVEMRLVYRDFQYYLKGVVGYRLPRNGKTQYGIIFIHIPSELDQMLDSWFSVKKTTNPPSGYAPDFQLVAGMQRRIDSRLDASIVTGKICKSSLLVYSSFSDCKIIDLSHISVGLLTNEHYELAEKVRLELLCDEFACRVEGTVSYMHPTDNGFHYGIDFTSAPPRLTDIIDTLHDAT